MTGEWVAPADVSASRKSTAKRRGFHADTGEKIEIGSIEKMSKSKKNVVDPDDIIASYGADTARFFVLSDSPPDRDVIWTEEACRAPPASSSASGGRTRTRRRLCTA
jgi:leucyl-tRNA synthetase